MTTHRLSLYAALAAAVIVLVWLRRRSRRRPS